MTDVIQNWLNYWNNKKEVKRKYGENPLPDRPNDSRKIMDSNKLNKNLEKIERLFENPEDKLHIKYNDSTKQRKNDKT